jgi:hypothetical protein
MYTKIIWEQGIPCELPEQFDPFLIRVWGGKDYLALGNLKRPESYVDEESKSIIEWLSQEYIRFTLLEQNQDLSESTIRQLINSGNWILKHLTKQQLIPDTIDDYKPLTKIFQKIAAKTRSDARNRSSDAKQGNRTPIIHLKIVNRFLTYLYPNDASFISDHLDHGKQFDSIIDAPSEFCVIESVRFVANLVESEEIKIREAISNLKEKTTITERDILTFFKLTKNYRNLFLYLFIATTGINATNAMLVDLEDLSIGSDKKTTGKSVSVYKQRANKVVSFEITKDVLIRYVNPFISIFKNYNLICEKFNSNYKLDYIGRQIFRQDEEYRHISQYYVFFSWLKAYRPRFINYINLRLTQENILEHRIKIPTPSDLRNYKATAIESKRGHIISSIIMQHSVEVGFKHYLRRQEKEAIENLGEFYADFENIIKNISEKVKDRLTVIPAGKCSASDEQKSFIQLNTAKSAYVIGDCTTPTGCLFCSFFVVHADEEGIYKLVSMREYILLKNKVLSYHSEIENNYGAIIDRINNILQHLQDELKEVAKQWIEKAENDVLYGLHPIWQELIDMDMALLEVTE